jgi:hypothetical protein
MIPVYFQTLLGNGLDAAPALAGFLTKKAAQGSIQAQHVSPRRGAPPVSRGFLAEKLTKTFHFNFSQCAPFRASEWLTAREALRVGLKEAIDTFIDFVVSGATSIGP